MPTIDVTHPEVAAQWHPTKNGDLKPSDVTAGSGRKVWWLCPKTCSEGCPHEWPATIGNRCALNKRCPSCSIPVKKICIHMSIIITHPYIASQWHPTKNNELKPSDVTAGSNKKVWWKCPITCKEGCIHEYADTIANRVNNRNCPHCSHHTMPCEHNSIQYTNPDIAKEWHPTKNNKMKPSDVYNNSNRNMWWICSKNPLHIWKARISSRISLGTGCPACINKTETKLLEYLTEIYPDIQSQYRASWCKSPSTGRILPFDFYIPSLNLLIELDGPQHFRQISNWDTCENTRKKDVFKMRAALKQGLSIIRLLQEDVLEATEEWLNDVLLPYLVPQLEAETIFIVTEGQKDMYSDHQLLLESSETEYEESVESERSSADNEDE